ncbi:hypothetical protein GX586_03660, partial [bacterium]|nr:hypothetical protein [bacterium]
WQSTVDGDWADAANWDPNTGYPNDPADTAIFTNLFMATNQAVTVTLPANAVTVGVLRVLYASNVYVLTGGRLVMTNSASTNALISTSTPAPNWPRPTYLTIRSELEILQDTVIAAPSYNPPDGVMVAGPLHGSGTITRGSTGSPGGYCAFTNAASRFDGVLRVHAGYSTYVYNDAMSNAAEVLVSYNARFGCYGADRIKKTTINTIGAFTFPGGSGGSSYGEWVLNCTGATVECYSGRSLYGLLQGTGIVQFAGNSPVSFLGGIKPGIDGVGSVSLIRAGGTPVLGSTASRAQLHIDIAGPGGVPGVDHDYLFVKNLLAPLSLSNIVLHVTGNSGATTNWFMDVQGTGTLSYVGTFFDVTNAPTIIVHMIYDTENRRIGVVAFPEPALLLSLLACAVPALRRKRN